MIPNILWQTWKTKEVPIEVKRQADSWIHSNPQLQINLMDDNECDNFILEHFGADVHFLYNALPQPIMRADFWRLAVVYIHGGYYSDLDIVCSRHISSFINNDVDAVFMREVNNISNYFFGAIPKHPVIKNALDMMINVTNNVANIKPQDFGMHPLHQSVRDYYQVVETNYITNDKVQFLLDADVRSSKTLVHNTASMMDYSHYESWRNRNLLMDSERENASDILFFTTFNRNGYELYGKEWIKSFTVLANYYNKFRAKIFYEGFVPPDNSHSNIEWVKYEDAIPNHAAWKNDYLSRTQHSDYVRTMTVRFSHKAFVIQHVLDTETHRYLIWLDGDCIFKNAEYSDFPKSLLGQKFLACQVDHNNELNQIESGILIFNGLHPDKMRFNNAFKIWYKVENILPMGQPYDGFLVSKALITTGLDYVNLNEHYGKGGIQSDPNMTFCHPEIKSKFIHNIGWTGKNQYDNWETIYQRDDIYQKMNGMLFGNARGRILEKKQIAASKMERLRQIKLNR